jgi:hypothetical protein
MNASSNASIDDLTAQISAAEQKLIELTYKLASVTTDDAAGHLATVAAMRHRHTSET